MNAQVVISRSRSDGEGVPAVQILTNLIRTDSSLRVSSCLGKWQCCLWYHSKGETSGHFTNRYIPLLYLKLGGFFM